MGKLSYKEYRGVVGSLPIFDFREGLMKKATASKEFSKLVNSGSSRLTFDDREVIISILTEVFPSLDPNLSDEELEGIAEAITYRSVSFK